MVNKNGQGYKMKESEPVDINNFTKDNLTEYNQQQTILEKSRSNSGNNQTFLQQIKNPELILKPTTINKKTKKPTKSFDEALVEKVKNDPKFNQITNANQPIHEDDSDNTFYDDDDSGVSPTNGGGMRKKYRPSIFDKKRRTRGKQSAHKCDILHKNSYKSNIKQKSQKNLKQNIKKRRQIYTRRNKK